MFTSALKMFLNSSVVTAVTDAYFNLVTLLLPGNGTNGAQNNTFLDSSSNNFTITRNGNTTQGTFSPFSQTGWSVFLDGSGDYLAGNGILVTTTTANTFSCEGWFYPTTFANLIWLVGDMDATGGTNNVAVDISTGGAVELYWWDGAAKRCTSTSVMSLNQWNYFAIVVNAGAISIYVNSTTAGQSGTTTLTNRSAASQNFAIGQFNNSTTPNGYISNLRWSTSARTISSIPTAPYTSDANTRLLTCQSNRFVDNSSNGFTLTPSGTPSVQAFSPFAPTAAYDAATVGGSGYFDGSGDYLSVADNANLRLGTSAFTIQAWIYRAASGTAHSIIAKGGASTGFVFQVTSGNVLRFTHGTTNVDTTTTIPASSWTHVAAVRTGTGTNQFQLYINGVSSVTATVATDFNQTDTLYVGADRSAATTMNGYISGLKYTNGTAESISVPTSPPTATTNVALLTNYTNAGITDATAKNDLETVGNAQISTTQSKFGGSSMYFDGTGDWLLGPSTQNCVFNTGDFTVEFWCYPTTLSASTDYNIIDFRDAQDTTSFRIGINGTTIPFVAAVGGILNGSFTFTTNNWYHFAVTRKNGTLTIWINGTSAGSNTTTTNFTGSRITVGAAINNAGPYFGYLDDVRVTKGYARYTASFTPPTAAFPVQ